MDLAVLHFSTITVSLLDRLASKGIHASLISIPSFASQTRKELASYPRTNEVLQDIHYLIEQKALSMFRLESNYSHLANLNWDQLGATTRINCLIQLRKYNFKFGFNDTESFLFLDCVANACLELISKYSIDIAIWGIIPHSLYDYLFMKILQSQGCEQYMFQEFSYCPSGSFIYDADLEMISSGLETSKERSYDFSFEATQIAHQVQLSGKAALCEKSVAVGAVKSYMPSGFEIEYANGLLRETLENPG